MNLDQGQTVMDIMNSIEGVNLHEKKGGRFKYRLYVTSKMRESSIDVLDLSPRPYNSLKRAGYDTVGDIIEAIEAGMDLKNLRHCGAKSVREIQEKLFLLQYNSLSAEKREAWLFKVIAMNMDDGTNL